MSQKDYRSWLKDKKASHEVITSEPTSGMSKEESERKVPGLTQPDGKPFIALGTAETASKLRAMKSGTERAVSLIDDAIRTRTGWSSDVGNSDEQQKLNAIWGQAKLAAKDTFELGAITESDVDLIKGALGTDDPSQWKDPVVGMLEARRLLVNRLNTELGGAGYEGPRYDIPEPPTAKPEETRDDRILKRAQDENIGSYTSFIADLENVNPVDRKKLSPAEKNAAYESSGGVPPGIRKQIDTWASQARGGDDQARAYLASLVETGGSQAVRAAARTALDSVMPSTEPGPSASVRMTAQDTIAQPRTRKR